MDQEAPRFINGDSELNIAGCVNNGIKKEIAEQIWDQMVDFAKYAFNRSHAAAYAAVSMQTAYLKAHYPLEFAAGLLTSVMDNMEKLTLYVSEYRKKGYKILPPDVNSCNTEFTVIGNDLCYGLAAIKGIGKAALDKIIEERNTHGQYKDFYDFIARTPGCDKKMLDNLAGSGALDFTQLTRRTLIESGEKYLEHKRDEDKKQVKGQMSFFDLFDNDSENKKLFSEENLPLLPEYPENELLVKEKETTGLYISHHPLDQYHEIIQKNDIMENTVLMEDPESGEYSVYDGQNIRIAGMIVSCKSIFTKRDNKPMAFLGIEDEVNSVDVVVFPKLYQDLAMQLEKDRPVIVAGKVSLKGDKASVLADNIFFLDEPLHTVWVQFQDKNDFYERKAALENIADLHRGSSRIKIAYRNSKKADTLKAHILANEKTLEELKKVYGSENIAVTEATYLI